MLQVQNIEKSYRTGGLWKKQSQQVLRDVSFTCKEGECLGIIGESGSGKSTLGRLILGIDQPDQGAILFYGQSVEQRKVRRGMISAVFQDYTSSINPFYTVEQAIREPLEQEGQSRMEQSRQIDELLEQVGLSLDYRSKYPHELSGGEAQRVCIARAVSTRPRYLVLDEAISSLDVRIQVQVLHLLQELKSVYGMGYIFITHDIQAAAYMCERMIIFQKGQIVETIDTARLSDVQSDYGRTLLSAAIAR
ncbi:ABC transporter ATP-binding protein [Paenibacillus shenyangensis]|uniref:ABC transporter ATP-binding protein n=1 Tax=Paenibacillus sp. A9 TaxID=1284352 RepID=UPI00036622D0|nr:ABC transporter ATP-binding protein [Paenibacillus sp. A9]